MQKKADGDQIVVLICLRIILRTIHLRFILHIVLFICFMYCPDPATRRTVPTSDRRGLINGLLNRHVLAYSMKQNLHCKSVVTKPSILVPQLLWKTT